MEEAYKTKINLGCGLKDIKAGYTNIDCIKSPLITFCDFEHDKLPFHDGVVDYIFCNHVLEHLRDVKNVLNEAWRVLRPGGKFEIKVPWGLWRGASKPVHHQIITDCWFDWLRRDDIYEWYGYRSWEIESMETKTGDEGPYELHVILVPKK